MDSEVKKMNLEKCITCGKTDTAKKHPIYNIIFSHVCYTKTRKNPLGLLVHQEYECQTPVMTKGNSDPCQFCGHRQTRTWYEILAIISVAVLIAVLVLIELGLWNFIMAVIAIIVFYYGVLILLAYRTRLDHMVDEDDDKDKNNQ